MIKKILAAMLTLTLVFSPAGASVFVDHNHTNTASAKSYKSGKRSFNSNRSNFQNNNRSNYQRNNRSYNSPSKSNSFRKGGFVRGMLFGGLAGMLFGGLLGHLGGFGAIFGLLVNVIAILIIIMIISKIFSLFRRNRRPEDRDSWRR
ncbi:hypothetical protein ACFVHQ_06620 [Actinomycetes bacterium NPDC127524]|uniref:hypothetical protein n=1 Tax=Bacillus sp. OV322 TaxID=1882764 RepID=UPI0008EA03AB|nr:hypothetical protein [Bacillus sp. OV322]SFC00240.1 hypothetical protein SAMN05443252_101397 [Bacillus sp. OV322]